EGPALADRPGRTLARQGGLASSAARPAARPDHDLAARPQRGPAKGFVPSLTGPESQPRNLQRSARRPPDLRLQGNGQPEGPPRSDDAVADAAVRRPGPVVPAAHGHARPAAPGPRRRRP